MTFPRLRKKKVGHPCTEAIVEYLACEFDHDDDTQTVIRDALGRMDGQVPPHLEIIVDNPVAANWRVKAAPRLGKWGLRISYYGFSQNPEQLAVEDLRNQALRYLAAP